MLSAIIHSGLLSLRDDDINKKRSPIIPKFSAIFLFWRVQNASAANLGP